MPVFGELYVRVRKAVLLDVMKNAPYAHSSCVILLSPFTAGDPSLVGVLHCFS